MSTHTLTHTQTHNYQQSHRVRLKNLIDLAASPLTCVEFFSSKTLLYFFLAMLSVALPRSFPSSSSYHHHHYGSDSHDSLRTSLHFASTSSPAPAVSAASSTSSLALEEMKQELRAASRFWREKVSTIAPGVSRTSLELFEKTLYRLLAHKYQQHWYTAEPLRGCGYRAIVCEGSADALLAQALKVAKIFSVSFSSVYITMNVNPGRVSVREAKGMWENEQETISSTLPL